MRGKGKSEHTDLFIFHDDSVALYGGSELGDVPLNVGQELVPVVDLLDGAVAEDQPVLELAQLRDSLEPQPLGLFAERFLLDSKVLLLAFRQA